MATHEDMQIEEHFYSNGTYQYIVVIRSGSRPHYFGGRATVAIFGSLEEAEDFLTMYESDDDED